jgi:c-di-AMP phosphodiesterase-like protein
MLFKLTDIEFDFVDSEGELPYDEQVAVAKSVIGEVFEVDNEDELADVISDETGWCVKSLDYVVIVESN